LIIGQRRPALEIAVVDRLVTATVLAHLTARPGKKAVCLEAGDAGGMRVSDSVYVQVTAPTKERSWG
jgi:hypothetical protein